MRRKKKVRVHLKKIKIQYHLIILFLLRIKMSAIIHTLIARNESSDKDDTVLVEFFQAAGNMSMIARSLMKKIAPNKSFTISYGDR